MMDDGKKIKSPDNMFFVNAIRALRFSTQYQTFQYSTNDYAILNFCFDSSTLKFTLALSALNTFITVSNRAFVKLFSSRVGTIDFVTAAIDLRLTDLPAILLQLRLEGGKAFPAVSRRVAAQLAGRGGGLGSGETEDGGGGGGGGEDTHQARLLGVVRDWRASRAP